MSGIYTISLKVGPPGARFEPSVEIKVSGSSHLGTTNALVEAATEASRKIVRAIHESRRSPGHPLADMSEHLRDRAVDVASSAPHAVLLVTVEQDGDEWVVRHKGKVRVLPGGGEFTRTLTEEEALRYVRDNLALDFERMPA